jgi:hypothetical protein
LKRSRNEAARKTRARDRQTEETTKVNEQNKSAKRKKPEHQLWIDSCAKAQDAIEEIIGLQQEYQGEYDEMSERKQESKKGELLSAICDLDLEGALATIEEAGLVELP